MDKAHADAELRERLLIANGRIAEVLKEYGLIGFVSLYGIPKGDAYGPNELFGQGHCVVRLDAPWSPVAVSGEGFGINISEETHPTPEDRAKAAAIAVNLFGVLAEMIAPNGLAFIDMSRRLRSELAQFAQVEETPLEQMPVH